MVIHLSLSHCGAQGGAEASAAQGQAFLNVSHDMITTEGTFKQLVKISRKSVH